jgi:hypothetical protein
MRRLKVTELVTKSFEIQRQRAFLSRDTAQGELHKPCDEMRCDHELSPLEPIKRIKAINASSSSEDYSHSVVIQMTSRSHPVQAPREDPGEKFEQGTKRKDLSWTVCLKYPSAVSLTVRTLHCFLKVSGPILDRERRSRTVLALENGDQQELFQALEIGI